MSAPAEYEIADWLKKLGMSEYAQRFAENRIDLSVLPDLTDQDLEKLGVVLGDRRKIMRAIANLDNAPPAAASAPAASVQPIAVTTAVPAPESVAERRQVTVMFSDLVGSTALSARMDPEDLREVISAYQKCVAETVQRFGGFVAKYMGMACLSTLAIRRPMRMTPSAQCGLDLSWLVLSVRSSQTLPCKPVSASRPGWS
jgi:SAM domain (Sterile alpha motif)/Adenylate and Guanylate cyclase catalytic domain